MNTETGEPEEDLWVGSMEAYPNAEDPLSQLRRIAEVTIANHLRRLS